MSKPDINELISRASQFLTDPEAFNQFLNSNSNMTKEQREKLRNLFNQLVSGSIGPNQNLFNQINDLLSSFKTQIPKEMGSMESIIDQMTKGPKK